MKSETFPRSARLLTSDAFTQVFNKPGGRASNRYFLTLARENSVSSARLGMVVGKKAVPLAKDRNRLKRLMRETFRRSEVREVPVDMVVLVRKGAHNCDNQDVRDQLASLWKEIHTKLKC